MQDDTLSIIAAIGIVFAAGAVVSRSRLPLRLKKLIYIALALRVAGAYLREWVLFNVYRGSGDARVYLFRARNMAERYWEGDFSPIYNWALWTDGRWWGTPFVPYPTSLTVSLIGPSLLANFIIFSLFAFLGLVGFAIAFRHSYPEVPLANYGRWIWLFPSLWYWPSSVGKDALLLMGLGLATAGFVGRKGRIRWMLLFVGLFFVFAIRAQVAAVVILSFILGYWLTLRGRWTTTKTVQTVLLFVVGMAGIWYAMKHIGVGGFDIEGVQEYMEDKAGSGSGGNSSFEAVDVGIGSIPIALMNILFRPFPWEVHNFMALLSSAEIWCMWAIVWWRRRSFVRALKGWRRDRFVATAISFVLVYAVMLGMLIANLGIVARQRIFLFPFLFLLIEAVPRLAKRRAPEWKPQPIPVPAMQAPAQHAVQPAVHRAVQRIRPSDEARW